MCQSTLNMSKNITLILKMSQNRPTNSRELKFRQLIKILPTKLTRYYPNNKTRAAHQTANMLSSLDPRVF